MADDRHARISEEAYRLWKAEGEPHGRDRDHWEQAERAFAGEGPVPEAADPHVDGDAAEAASAVGDDAAEAPAAAPATPKVTAPPVPAGVAAPSPAPTPAPAPTKTAAKKPATRRKRTT